MTKPISICPILPLIIWLLLFHNVSAASDSVAGSLVKRNERKSLVETEYGDISEVKISAGERGPYHLEFITLDPNSLFLPVLLHSDMVFYVHTGSGTVNYTDDDDTKTLNLRRGDIFRLQPGSVFYIHSSLEPEREKLRIHALFSNTDEDYFERSIGSYSSIAGLVFGFDTKILQSAFKASEEIVESMTNTTKPPAIVRAAAPEKKTTFMESEVRFLKSIINGNRNAFYEINKKKSKTFNIIDADPDFENNNGWSKLISKKDAHILKGSNVGVFMVNLTKGSMMGPHWNPSANEISVVLQGEGMIRVVCSRGTNASECMNLRFKVQEGDVFAVPRFHPMAHMSFENESFVFMGFSTTKKNNYPQFIAGKSSVLQVLDREVLGLSFNVTNSTVLEKILSQQEDAIILNCTFCAEEEERVMEEEMRREREEETRRKEEEEARKREKEEEEVRKREEEEARKREEVEEEEARRHEEERRQREKEQEEERKREREEEERKKEEEAARKREEEEEEVARREEEKRRQREKEQEERKRHERKREEERRREEEEEEARKREQEQEEEARRQEEERKRQEQEREEESRRQEEEEARKREEKERRQKEKRRGQEREREEEEERERRVEEEGRRREEAATREQEEARRQEEERKRRAREEEEEGREPRAAIMLK